jgi:dienelactone hydrolase
MSRSGRFLVVLVVAAACAISAPAQVQVQFEGATLDGGKIRLTGLLDVPEGKGPFPAVVLLHDAEGLSWDLGAVHYAAWAERLVQWGYVALRVDSFGPRGFSKIQNPSQVSPRARSLDAYAARDWLVRQKSVGKKPVAVMGWSHGAMAVMYVVDGAYRPSAAKPFQACVSFYPVPAPPSRQDTPLLLIAGEDDPFCFLSMVRDLEASWAKGSRKFELAVVTYAKATHAFDVPGLNEDLDGVHYEYDPVAAADAIEQVKAFLEKNIGRPAR